MYKKVFRILFTVIVSVLLTVQPAYAKGEPPPQHDKVIHTQSGETLYLDFFEEVGKPYSSTNNIGSNALAASGCKSLTNGVNIYNSLNQLVLKYSQKTNWCYNGTNITSVSHIHTPTVYNPGYHYNGLISDNHWGGVGQASFRAYSQASFCEFLPGVGCLTYVYPWVDQTVRGTGTYTGTAGY